MIGAAVLPSSPSPVKLYDSEKFRDTMPRALGAQPARSENDRPFSNWLDAVLAGNQGDAEGGDGAGSGSNSAATLQTGTPDSERGSQPASQNATQANTATAERIADALIRAMLASGVSQTPLVQNPVVQDVDQDPDTPPSVLQASKPTDSPRAAERESAERPAIEKGTESKVTAAVLQPPVMPVAETGPAGLPIVAAPSLQDETQSVSRRVETNQPGANRKDIIQSLGSDRAMDQPIDSTLMPETVLRTPASQSLAFAAIMREKSGDASGSRPWQVAPDVNSSEGTGSNQPSAGRVSETKPPDQLPAIAFGFGQEQSNSQEREPQSDSPDPKSNEWQMASRQDATAAPSIASAGFQQSSPTHAAFPTASTSNPHAPRDHPASAEPANAAQPMEAQTLETSVRNTPVREMVVRVSQPSAPSVDLAITRRQGEIHVAVRTANLSLSESLRDNLPDLVRALDRKGFATQAFIPAKVEAVARGEWTSDSPPDSREGSQDTEPRKSRSGQESFQQSSQQSGDQRRHRERSYSQWLANIED